MSMGKPIIRFKGYEDDWEQRKLGDVAEKVCVGFVGTCEKFYTDESGVPMYRTGNLNGLSLNRDDLKYVTHEFHQQNQKSQLKTGDILIARHGDSGKAVNYESSEEANCLNIVIIRPNFNECNYKFLTNCINSPGCQKHIKSLSAGSTQAVINTSEIEKLEVVMPVNIDEQNSIASYFSIFDHLITLHQRKCEQTKKLKKYMLQNMFPQNEEKVPKIRFEGFTDDWEQRKWIDTVDISTEMVDPTSGEYDDMPHIAPGNIESFTGRLLDNVKTVKEEQLISGKFRFRPDDVVYGKINPQLGKYFYARVDGLTSADAYVFKGKNGTTQKFLFSLLQTRDFFKYSVSVSKRSGMPKINRDELNAYIFLEPSEEEQDKIGSFLLNIDHLITLHQRKCDELQKIKKFMLQNMFL